MPLIDCPDCGKKISDAAPACPQCGRPASQELTLEVAQKFLQYAQYACLQPGRAVHRARVVDLSEFKSIADVAAEALAKHKGILLLDGLTTLSDAAAKALAKHEGELCLDGLKTLSDAAAEALGKHKGKVVLGDDLKTLSDAVAKALGKHNPLAQRRSFTLWPD